MLVSCFPYFSHPYFEKHQTRKHEPPITENTVKESKAIENVETQKMHYMIILGVPGEKDFKKVEIYANDKEILEKLKSLQKETEKK